MLHPIPHSYRSGTPLVEINGLSCGYEKQRVLERVDLEIMRGDFVAFWVPAAPARLRCSAQCWAQWTSTKAKCWLTVL